MFVGSLGLFGATIAIMGGIVGLAILVGVIHSRVKYNRFMKVFNEDCAKSRFEKLPN